MNIITMTEYDENDDLLFVLVPSQSSNEYFVRCYDKGDLLEYLNRTSTVFAQWVGADDDEGHGGRPSDKHVVKMPDLLWVTLESIYPIPDSKVMVATLLNRPPPIGQEADLSGGLLGYRVGNLYGSMSESHNHGQTPVQVYHLDPVDPAGVEAVKEKMSAVMVRKMQHMQFYVEGVKVFRAIYVECVEPLKRSFTLKIQLTSNLIHLWYVPNLRNATAMGYSTFYANMILYLKRIQELISNFLGDSIHATVRWGDGTELMLSNYFFIHKVFPETQSPPGIVMRLSPSQYIRLLDLFKWIARSRAPTVDFITITENTSSSINAEMSYVYDSSLPANIHLRSPSRTPNNFDINDVLDSPSQSVLSEMY